MLVLLKSGLLDGPEDCLRQFGIAHMGACLCLDHHGDSFEKGCNSSESLQNMHQKHVISNNVIAGMVRKANGWTEEK